MRDEFYEAALTAVRLQRSAIFRSADSQMPISECEDALIPQIGFIGAVYRHGGTVLLGINPGGGGDAYRRTAADEFLLPMIAGLRQPDATPDALRAMFAHSTTAMRTWNLWRIAQPVIEACGITQSEISYLNWCPFRTRNDKKPHAYEMRQSRDIYLEPMIRELAPRRIIALGKKAGDLLMTELNVDAVRYVVPRTRGDRYICADAIKVIAEIRQTGQPKPRI